MNIAERYDSMPYPTNFFGETNPSSMGALGTILGLEISDPRDCRVLEFGCGDGSNLISHAYTLPGTEFVGVDISGEHIKTAKTWAAEIGLSNIEFRKADVMEMSELEFGKFDYLVAHGLITWIPEAVIEKVFELFGTLMTDTGIGYVSYNCYPGAHLRKMAREMMMFHTQSIDSPLEKVEAANSFLNLIADNTSDQTAYRQVLSAEKIRHTKHSPSDFFHDDLSDFYFPYYFSEISAKLEENGLQYLCESEFHSMSPRNLSPILQEFFKDVADLTKREDYLDFARGRQFRKTLFCKQGRDISRTLEPERLSNIAIASTVKPDNPDDVLKESTRVRFVSQLGAGIEIDHLITKCLLTQLGLRDGAPIHFDEIMESVKNGLEVSDWEKEEGFARQIVLRLVEDTNILDLYSFADPIPSLESERPKTSPLAVWQLRVGASITTPHGTVIDLSDSVAQRLLELADGSRDISEITKGVEDFVTSEAIQKEVRGDLEAWVEESILSLSKSGIFVAE